MFNGKKLTELMNQKRYTDKKMAEILNAMNIEISHNTIRGYKSGNSPRLEVLSAIAEVLGVLEQDLIESTARIRNILYKRYGDKGRELGSDKNVIQLEENVVGIPMIVTGAGAEALADLSNCEMIYIEKSLLNHYTNNKNIIAAKIIGNSMESEFRENDIVLIELVKNQNYVKVDGVYLVRYGEIVQLKEVQFLGNGEILLKSSNSNYSAINPTKDYGIDWEILGKPLVKVVVEYYSDLQYINSYTIEK